MSDGRLKFLCFTLGKRVFSLTIMGIREILRMQAVTQVPGAPETVLGVVNVRGELITVIDTRRVLGIEDEPPNPRDVRIVLASSGGVRFGMMVDLVLDVVTVSVDEIEPAPIETKSGLVMGLFRKPGDDSGQVVVLLRLAAAARLARGEKVLASLEELDALLEEPA